MPYDSALISMRMSPLRLGPLAVVDSGVFKSNIAAPMPPSAIPSNFRVVIDDPIIAADAIKTKIGLIVIINEACTGLVIDRPLKKQS